MSARRPVTHRPQCAEPECGERALYEFDTQRDYREHLRQEQKRPWRCTRHTRPEEVLAPDNKTRATVLVATRLDHLPDHLFWIPEGKTTGSGFTHGPGFKAFANDWPEGTRIEILARVLPSKTEETA